MALSEIYQEEKNRWRSSFLRSVVFSLNSILILMIALRFFRDFSFHPADFVLSLTVAVYFMMLLLARKGFLALASILLVAFTYAAICYLSFTAKGIYDSSVFAFMTILAISYLLLGWQYSLGVLILSVGWIWFLGVAEMKGLIEYHGVDPIPDYARDISFTLLILAVLSHSYLKRIDNYIERISQELNERKRAEQELALKEENYRILFEQASEGILIGDYDGFIINFNAARRHLELFRDGVCDLFQRDGYLFG